MHSPDAVYRRKDRLVTDRSVNQLIDSVWLVRKRYEMLFLLFWNFIYKIKRIYIYIYKHYIVLFHIYLIYLKNKNNSVYQPTLSVHSPADIIEEVHHPWRGRSYTNNDGSKLILVPTHLSMCPIHLHSPSQSDLGIGARTISNKVALSSARQSTPTPTSPLSYYAPSHAILISSTW